MLDKQRTLKLLNEAHEDLQRYNDLRTNTLQMIEVYRKRLALLGEQIAEKELPLPGVEAMTQMEMVDKGPPLREYIETVLKESSKPLSAREIWEIAYQLGARTSSTNPARLTDVTLRSLVKKGRAKQVAPGRFAA